MVEKKRYEIELLLKNLTEANVAADKYLKKVEKIKQAQEDANKPIEDMKKYFSQISPQTSSIIGDMDDMVDSLKGAQGFISNIGKAFWNMVGAARAFLVAMAPYALIIGAVVLGILTIRRMWQLNVGGMQNTFFKVWGAIKDAFGAFMVVFDNFLRSLSPVVRVIMSFIDGIVDPIQDVLKFVKPILENMKLFGDQSKENKELWDGLAMVAKVLGYIVAGIVIGVGAIIVAVVKLQSILFSGVKFILGYWKALYNFVADIFTQPNKALVNLKNNLLNLFPDWLKNIINKLFGGKSSVDVKNTTVSQNTMKNGAEATGARNYSSIDNRQAVVNVNTSRAIDAKNGQAFGNILANQINYS